MDEIANGAAGFQSPHAVRLEVFLAGMERTMRPAIAAILFIAASGCGIEISKAVPEPTREDKLLAASRRAIPDATIAVDDIVKFNSTSATATWKVLTSDGVYSCTADDKIRVPECVKG